MKKSIYLIICLTISLTISLNAQVINSQESDKMEGINRKSSFNVEEIKVRWKKAALENCIGVPCTSTFSCTAATPSASPTIGCASSITPITIATTGATGIGTATGLPAGITASWSGNVITISGSTTVPGTYSYTIPLTGSCSSVVNATGTFIVVCAS